MVKKKKKAQSGKWTEVFTTILGNRCTFQPLHFPGGALTF